MPVTPFHFGPALLLKAMTPRFVSLTAFCVSQVVIDVETAYNIVEGRWPLHRECHTLLWGSLIGVVVGLSVSLVSQSLLFRRALEAIQMRGDCGARASIIGGSLGGISHSLLDAVMHSDVTPFAPWSELNPLLGIVSVPLLHAICAACGVVGVLQLRSASGVEVKS